MKFSTTVRIMISGTANKMSAYLPTYSEQLTDVEYTFDTEDGQIRIKAPVDLHLDAMEDGIHAMLASKDARAKQCVERIVKVIETDRKRKEVKKELTGDE